MARAVAAREGAEAAAPEGSEAAAPVEEEVAAGVAAPAAVAPEAAAPAVVAGEAAEAAEVPVAGAGAAEHPPRSGPQFRYSRGRRCPPGHRRRRHGRCCRLPIPGVKSATSGPGRPERVEARASLLLPEPPQGPDAWLIW